MQTPKEFSENLKNKIITTEMLNACLYSVNKRAKNYRDTKREYRGKYRDSAERKELAFYRKKEQLLSIITPVCIHKSMVGYERIRVYDYESGFSRKYLKNLLLNQVVHTNSYWDYDAHDEVFFFDYLDTSKPKSLYFLFYELGKQSYHTPIDNPKNYSLPVKDIGKLNTEGDDYHDLISVQFVDKVIALIDSQDYIYQETEPTVSQKYVNETPNAFACNGELDCNETSEIRSILNCYLVPEVQRRCFKVCENETFEFNLNDYKIRQTYSQKNNTYKHPYVKARQKKRTKLHYELDLKTTEKLREVVKNPNFTFIDLVDVICDNLDYRVYSEFYQNCCMQKVAESLQQAANVEYQKEPKKLSIEEVATKCGLLTEGGCS